MGSIVRSDKLTGSTSGPTLPGSFEDMKSVAYDLCESRAGEHARKLPGEWEGSLTCDDFSGYKAWVANGVTEVGCPAHARRDSFLPPRGEQKPDDVRQKRPAFEHAAGAQHQLPMGVDESLREAQAARHAQDVLRT